MADVSHELGALRFVVESPLSSKVAMFNNAVSKHQENQHLNPFSQTGGLPRPTFKKGEYGKPIAGSLTEQRGQKANIHVLKEMLELCQIIDSEGYNVKDEPEMKVIPFGELFNIYTYISDKVVGILLRARKHKLIEFEGEVLFQHRDEDVPIFLLKPIKEIRQILTDKQEEIRRSVSPSPQATSVMMDQQKMRQTPSPSPTPKPKAITKKAQEKTEGSNVEIVKPIAQKANPVINVEDKSKDEIVTQAVTAEPALQEEPAVKPVEVPAKALTDEVPAKALTDEGPAKTLTDEAPVKALADEVPAKTLTDEGLAKALTDEVLAKALTDEGPAKSEQTPPATIQTVVPETIITPPTPTVESAPTAEPAVVESVVEAKPDVNNNEEAPAIVVTNTDEQTPVSAPTPN